MAEDFTNTNTDQRERLVAEQIEARGVRDQNVLSAMRVVRRELFVPEHLRDLAYEDRPLPIGAGQTISQPYIVAFMLEALALQGGERVLEVGTGSGYAAAVLSQIANEVFSIERIGLLAQQAAANLADAGIKNVRIRHDDGTIGWIDEAPFDAILVSAGAPRVPRTLMHQLKTGGRLVVPVGSDVHNQELIRITRVSDDEFRQEDIAAVRFVPLIGQEGWQSDDGNSLDTLKVTTPTGDGRPYNLPWRRAMRWRIARITACRVLWDSQCVRKRPHFGRFLAPIKRDVL